MGAADAVETFILLRAIYYLPLGLAFTTQATVAALQSLLRISRGFVAFTEQIGQNGQNIDISIAIVLELVLIDTKDLWIEFQSNMAAMDPARSPLLSIILPNRCLEDVLHHTIASILDSDDSRYQLLIAENSYPAHIYLDEYLTDPRVKLNKKY